MWFFFSCFAGVLYTFQSLITRRILKQNKDAWAFSFYFSLIGALVSLPFLLIQPKIPHNGWLWILLICTCFFIVLQNYLYFTSLRFLEASVQGTVTKFRLVWIFILGVILLHEAFTLNKIIGVVLTLIAGWLITYRFGNKKNSLTGILFAFSSTLFYAVVVVCYKYLFYGFNSQSLTFFIFFFPALINIFIMPNAIQRIKILLKTHSHWLIGACILGSFANLAMNYALSIGEASRVVVLIEAFLIATLAGENILLKEKDNLLTKIIAAIIVIIGAIFMKI